MKGEDKLKAVSNRICEDLKGQKPLEGNNDQVSSNFFGLIVH